MKKGSIVLWSIITYVVVCLLELLICKSSIIPHWGLENYTLVENTLFYSIAVLSGALVAFLLRTKDAKELLINSIIMWCIFVFLGQIIGLRHWIGIFTDNESIVLGVNFLGDDIWISHYIGCFIGMVTDIIILMFRKIRNRKYEK